MSSMFHTLKKLSYCAAAAMVLSACGGGGSDSPAPTPTPDASTPTPEPTPTNFSESLDLTAVSQQDPGSSLPANWNRTANFMEIYVRGYKDSDGDGVGDIQGVIEKLPYLESLGITGIWLMPVHESSDNDHGYAVTDYRDIETDYGSMADFQELLTEAHNRGIGIIMDYVVNHSSSSNPLFLDFASSASSENQYRDWYMYSDTDLGWGAFGDGWHEIPGSDPGYFYGAFWSGMPDFNLANQDVVDFHLNNLRFWLNMGVDGFRFDAVGVLFENGADGTIDQPENFVFMKQLQDMILSYENRYIVCEGPDGPYAFAESDGCGTAFAFGQQGNILNTARNGALSPGLITHLENENAPNMPLFLSNHDRFAGDRIGTQLSDVDDMKIASAINILLSATPFTYYGEEIGISNGAADGDWALRTPMSWTSDATGFSSATPFRVTAGNIATNNVEAQENVAGSLLEHYRSMYMLKNDNPVLSMGDLNVQSGNNATSLVFTRRDGTNAAAVLMNLADTAQDLTVLTGAADTAYTVEYPANISDGTTGNAASLGSVTINVPAQSVVVFSYADGSLSVFQCFEPEVVNDAGDGCDLPVSDSQPDPVATAGANEVAIYYKNDTDDYSGLELHIWNGGGCAIYTDAQLEGVEWATGVQPGGIDPNYGVYWVLDINPGTSIGDCGNFIIHEGDTKYISDADQVAVIDEDRIVFGVQRYADVFPELWILAP